MEVNKSYDPLQQLYVFQIGVDNGKLKKTIHMHTQVNEKMHIEYHHVH